jgi:DNA-directed RNA polymerase subunit RPC12/RpoP
MRGGDNMHDDECIYCCTKCTEDMEPFEVDALGKPVSYICTSCGSIFDLEQYNVITGKEN